MTIRVNNTVITSETELKDRLDLLYTDSASGKSFNGLMELVTNEHTIKMAIHNIKSNTGSKTPGIDGKTIDDYLSWYDVNGSIQSFCDEIREMLRDYRPKPVRRIYVPKQNGKMRPIGIPTMMDRIIQECLRIILEPIVEARFYTNSYGFRPYRDASQAIARIVSLLNENSGNAHWVVEGDIKGYFDNVDHKILLRKLWENGIIDKRIIEIIRRTLQAGVLEDGKITKSDKGTPQGGLCKA